MQIKNKQSEASYLVRLSDRVTVRLSWLIGEDHCNGPTDFMVAVLGFKAEFQLELNWSQLLLLAPLTSVKAGEIEVRFTAGEQTTLEREGWLILIGHGKYPTAWRSPIDGI
jgi:hypothetical protein